MYRGFSVFLSPAVVIPNILTSTSGHRFSIARLTISVCIMASLLCRVPSVKTLLVDPFCPGIDRASKDLAMSCAIAGSVASGKLVTSLSSVASSAFAGAAGLMTFLFKSCAR